MSRIKAVSVKPLEDYKLLLEFSDGEKRIFDCSPYLNGDWFSELKDISKFETVHIAGLSVEWAGGQDLCPDCLYEQSVIVA